jgi:dipeptidase E
VIGLWYRLMRKLVLYSDQVPGLSDKIDLELLTLFDKPNPVIGYIPSAADNERRYFRDRQEYYSRIGIELKIYYGLEENYDSKSLSALLSCDAIHLSGGNTYYFLFWLRKRNMIAQLIQYVAGGGILIGVSAGAILMTPDISTSHICGDEILEGMNDYRGLNLVDFSFLPHYGTRSIDPDKLRKYSQEHGTVIYMCRDSDGIIIDGDVIKCIGDVTVIDNRPLFK